MIENGDSGFAALLGGYRNSDGEYLGLGRDGYYWSASENGADNAWDFYFNSDNQRVNRGGDSRRTRALVPLPKGLTICLLGYFSPQASG